MDKPRIIEAEPEPGCSSWINNIGIDQRPTSPPSVFFVVSPQQVMPNKRNKETRKNNYHYFFSVQKLIGRINRKKEIGRRQQEKKTAQGQKKNKKTKLTKRATHKKNKKNHTSPEQEEDEYGEDEDNIPCFYCNGRYLESNEGQVACSLCGNCAHCNCAGIDDEDDEAVFMSIVIKIKMPHHIPSFPIVYPVLHYLMS